MNIYKYLLLMGVAVLGTSCGDDDVENPNPPNEEELITTVILTFSPSAGTDVVAIWKDTDGPGGNLPEIDEILLEESEDYDLFVQFLNESNPTDVEDITEEIKEEDDEHQIFYSGTAEGTVVNYNYADMDENGLPVGLSGTIDPLITGTGTFRITLKHLPEIKNAGSSINDGDTDIEVDFNLEVF